MGLQDRSLTVAVLDPTPRADRKRIAAIWRAHRSRPFRAIDAFLLVDRDLERRYAGFAA